jgi:hypothetical protein
VRLSLNCANDNHVLLTLTLTPPHTLSVACSLASIHNFSGIHVDFDLNDVRHADSSQQDFYMMVALKWTQAPRTPLTFLQFQNPVTQACRCVLTRGRMSARAKERAGEGARGRRSSRAKKLASEGARGRRGARATERTGAGARGRRSARAK